ncbi:MAG: response regulator [Pseudomonadota bacterium]
MQAQIGLPEGDTLKVVLIDDDDLDRFVIKRSFNAIEPPVELIEVSDPRQAVKTIIDQQPHVTLLDIQMPHMSGFDVLKELGSQAGGAALLDRTLMLSSSAQLNDRERSQSLGAKAYRTKPSTLDDYITLAKDVHKEYLNSK